MFRLLKFNAVLATLLSFICLSGCSSFIQHEYSDLDQLKFAADPKNSTYTSYDLTGAIWVKDQPLLVNKDFNFGMAMSLEGVGTAIAVGMRNNKNEALVKQLASMPPIDLNERFQHHLNDVKSIRDKYQINVFAMLYGQPKANLQTFVEFQSLDPDAEKNNFQRFVYVSDWKDVEGEMGWSANKGALINEQLEISLQEIAVMVDGYLSSDELNFAKEDKIKYSVTGGESVKRGAGIIVGRNDERVLVWDENIASTLVSYPENILDYN